MMEKTDVRFNNGGGDNDRVTFISGNQKYTDQDNKGKEKTSSYPANGYCCIWNELFIIKNHLYTCKVTMKNVKSFRSCESHYNNLLP